MFTGIVEGVARLTTLEKKTGLFSFTFQFPSLPKDLKIGDSIAIDGTCLTVTAFKGNEASFDLMATTLDITTLGQLAEGDGVNYEPAARFGDSIGGHAVSGHIHCQATLSKRDISENNLLLTFDVPEDYRKYIFDKGYIAVGGASLTIAGVTDSGFSVSLIPETRRLTVFEDLPVGGLVNLEIDTQTQTLVDTLERLLPDMLARQLKRSGQ